MITYAIDQIDTVTLSGGGALADMDLMSPYVWRESDRYRIMMRGVPRPFLATSATGYICCGDSSDGLNFSMNHDPVIVPGPGPDDAGGCEDPTVVAGSAGGYSIFYTGVDMERQQGSLLLASGPSLTALTKQRVVLQAPAGEGNIKEATLAQTSTGEWRLFYEYAANDASRIGVASAPDLGGPWTALADPFGVRADSWDNWHLSTGPIIQVEGQDPVMFYNGATHDARWRIGWISFDEDFGRVTGRGIEPMLVPPPVDDRTATDIAFAASALVENGRITLYYSIEDRMLRRALIGRYGPTTAKSPDPT